MRAKIIFAALSLSACASNAEPEVSLKTEKEIHSMNRHEVISAITDCQSAGLRPVMIYGRVRVAGRPSPIVLDVTCAPPKEKL
jgi:hypothetical protein